MFLRTQKSRGNNKPKTEEQRSRDDQGHQFNGILLPSSPKPSPPPSSMSHPIDESCKLPIVVEKAPSLAYQGTAEYQPPTPNKRETRPQDLAVIFPTGLSFEDH